MGFGAKSFRRYDDVQCAKIQRELHQYTDIMLYELANHVLSHFLAEEAHIGFFNSDMSIADVNLVTSILRQ